MPDLSIVANRLQLMRQRLLPFTDAFFKGAPEEMQERNLRTAELERIGDDLRLIARDLQNEQNLLQVMQRNLSSIPLDKRYSASQSLDQRQKNLQRVKKEAEQLAEAVRDLMKKKRIPISHSGGHESPGTSRKPGANRRPRPSDTSDYSRARYTLNYAGAC